MATKKTADSDQQYAVIELGTKQYLVTPGDKITAEKIELKEGEKLNVKQVLLIHSSQDTKVGTPYVESASVDLVLNKQLKGEKINVRKFRSKSRYRRSTGHRQSLSEFTVEAINLK